MRATKTLGQAEPEVDDLGAWVRRSRALEEKAKAEAREKALRQARALQQQVWSRPCFCAVPHTVLHLRFADQLDRYSENAG